ncbi:hypothetical protein [Nonomuraea sp. SBT364]|uniref:hypothetical protein n=1 Tax=Nonomuraea sp. SBT364 TaxID=1580530 RepID=UPI00066D542C|nr:hypothetical protein [Nonomuraea sp. SBT364]
MRTRLPAALLLLLSWFLPTAGHAQLTAGVAQAALQPTAAAGHAAGEDSEGGHPAAGHVAGEGPAAGRAEAWRAAGHPGARRSPYLPPTAHSWTASYDATGGNGPAVLPSGAHAPGQARAGAVRRHGGADPVARRPAATPARAPPSTRL